MTPLAARQRFDALLSVPDDRLDVLRIVLAVAAEEDAALDPESVVAQLDAAVARTSAGLPPLAPEMRRLAALNDLVFRDLGLDGAGCDFHSPDASFLHRVLAQRTGLPIVIALLWVELGRKLGLATAGVSFPGHFLAKVRIAEGELFTDPFNKGRVLPEPELKERARKAGVPAWDPKLLEAAPARQVVARVLRNLKNLYAKRRDFPRAFAAADRLLVATPESWEDVRDRGLYCIELGGLPAARRDLERYLAARPQAHDADALRERLASLRSDRVLLN